MDIAFIHPSYPGAEGSGAVHTATAIVSELSSRGHDVTVFCPKSPDSDQLPDADFSFRIMSESIAKPHPYLHANRALSKCADEFAQYDVVHSYLSRTIPAVAEIRRASGTATVNTLNDYGGVCPKNDLLYKGNRPCFTQATTRCVNCILHTSHEAMKYKAGDLINIYLARLAQRRFADIDRYHVQARHVAKKYERFDFPTEKIETVPNILDDRFLIDHRSSFSEPYRLLYVGRLKRSKGTDRLIPVFSEVEDKLSIDCRLTIVGSGKGDFETMLREQASQLGVSKKVTFKGHVNYADIPDVYASHDIYVYPGRWDEPFARVFLEAMATGTPVVSTDVGGVREILAEAGMVVNSNENLASAIVNAISSGKLENMSVRGKQRAQNFRPDVVIPQFEELYEEASTEAARD